MNRPIGAALMALFSDGFRPFFLLLSGYLVLSIGLWGLQWGGILALQFTQTPVQWHMYEMLFGLGSAGIAGFLLTALPEFFEQQPPVGRMTLVWLTVLWLFGRLAFWWLDRWGIWPAAISHLALSGWLLAITAPPILADSRHQQLGLLLALGALTGLQAGFFAIRLGWLASDAHAWLLLVIGVFMSLILLVLRRVSTVVISTLITEQWQLDERFIARPPLFNLAISVIVIGSLVEFWLGHNAITGWLYLACAAALLNLTNDYIQLEHTIIWRNPVWLFYSIPLLMAAGYGLLGIDYLNEQIYLLNHARHLLLSGALGLAYLLVLMVVTHVHTGRTFQGSGWLSSAAGLIVLACGLRVSIAWHPMWASVLYASSALLWGLAFVLYLGRFGRFLWQPNRSIT